jgi:hypothetical protein
VPKHLLLRPYSRRAVLRLGGGLAAAAALPPLAVGCGDRALGDAAPQYLTSDERAALAALADRILPPDTDPGAEALGVVDYVDRLLSAFDGPRVPPIYAGGPTSDRNPFPDADGQPQHRFPDDDFARFVPLSRLQELRWRAELFGSAAVPGADVNDAVLGSLRGLRDIYRDGLARVDAAALEASGRRFAELDPAAQDELFDALDSRFAPEPRRDATFLDIVIQHTLEACFAPPEYGGNRDARGWAMLELEGDVHPLGFSVFATARGDYVERPDHPMSTPNPDEIGPDGSLRPRPLTADGERVQTAIVALATLLPAD